MRFRVQNIHNGYCEVWANEHDGGRYQKLATVMRDDDGSWHWSAKDEPPFFMPYRTNEFDTRRECVNHCMKTALKRLVRHAIERQPKDSQHWHSPRRDAFFDVKRSCLFTCEEMAEMAKRLATFEEDQ